MKTQVSNFDLSEALDSDEMIAEYISAVLEENNTSLLLAALEQIAKAKGIAEIAHKSGISRESLYKIFNEGAKPRFDTISKVLNALNIQLAAVSKQEIAKPLSVADKKAKYKA